MTAPLLAIIAFAIAASFTPGPNNIMVAASGAQHGFRASLPACAGVACGFALMVAIVGLGVASVLAVMPTVATVARWVAIAWLLFLAWRVAWAGAPGSGRGGPPVGFLGAALFQWVNPKAWLLAIGANTAFVTPGHPLLPQVLVLSLVFLLCGAGSTSAWNLLGAGASRFLRVPWRVRAFNLVMAVAMVASIIPVAFEG